MAEFFSRNRLMVLYLCDGDDWCGVAVYTVASSIERRANRRLSKHPTNRCFLLLFFFSASGTRPCWITPGLSNLQFLYVAACRGMHADNTAPWHSSVRHPPHWHHHSNSAAIPPQPQKRHAYPVHSAKAKVVPRGALDV